MQFQVNKWKVVRGESATIINLLLDEDKNAAFISGAIDTHILLQKQDGTVLDKPAVTATVLGTVEPLSVFTFEISNAESALLKVGAGLSVQVKVNYGAGLAKAKYFFYDNALDVVDPEF